MKTHLALLAVHVSVGVVVRHPPASLLLFSLHTRTTPLPLLGAVVRILQVVVTLVLGTVQQLDARLTVGI